MRKLIRSLWRSEAGATAIEYGLIAALIGIVTIAGLTAIGTCELVNGSGFPDSP